VDGQEVGAPEDGDEGGEKSVAGGHASTVSVRTLKDNREYLYES
jgi:hypothetical protein